VERRLAIALCLSPLALSLPALCDPFGNSEESLNAAIWSLGAKNLVELGPGRALRGALVLPHGGTRGDGVYAHHPPLPVWLMTLPVALGGWEGFARLLGLGCACSALWLLWRLLLQHFEARPALLGLAAAATSVFALRYGRLFTTLTLATPLFLALLLVRKPHRGPNVGSPPGSPRHAIHWAPLLVALLVLSSWDGVVAAGVVAFISVFEAARGGVTSKAQLAATGAAFVFALGFVVWHLLDATGGVSELAWQFRWRAAGDDVTWAQWAGKQVLFLGEGLGPLSLLALCAAPFLATREQRPPLLLLAAPGLVMLVVFRQGAVKHAFWGYNLVLPAAFAVAQVATRWPRAAALVAAQALLLLGVAAYRLSEEHAQSQVGRVAQQLPRGAPVPVLARGSFHPYVSWYAGGKPVTVRKLSELPAAGDLALVDTEYARELGCAVPAGARWQILALFELRKGCALIADALPPLR
jgi:hypothetical protein